MIDTIISSIMTMDETPLDWYSALVVLPILKNTGQISSSDCFVND